MKIIMIVIDGLFDEPNPKLGNKTPLEVADVKTIKSLLKNSVVGLIDNRLIQTVVTSDIAVARLLGLRLENLHDIPRSILEIISENIPFKNGNLALHCNFATINIETSEIIDRRAGRTLKRGEAKILERDINTRVKLERADFIFKHIIDYVSVLVFKDPERDLSIEISETDPWRPGEEKKLKLCKPLGENVCALASCKHLNEFTLKSIEILNTHPVNIYRRLMGLLPVNCIICRQPGNKLPSIKGNFKDNFNLIGAAQARLPTERGIAKLIGLNVIDLPLIEPFENLGAYYYERAIQIIENIKYYDFIYAHIDEADDAAHDRDPMKKKNVIEVIDRFFLSEIVEYIMSRGEEITLILTADHGTSSITGHHLNTIVPALIYNPKFKREKAIEFNEHLEHSRVDFYIKAEDFMSKIVLELARRV